MRRVRRAADITLAVAFRPPNSADTRLSVALLYMELLRGRSRGLETGAGRMATKVIWFEVLGKDGDKLRGFFAELFGWRYNDAADPKRVGALAEPVNLDGYVRAMEARFRA